MKVYFWSWVTFSGTYSDLNYFPQVNKRKKPGIYLLPIQYSVLQRPGVLRLARGTHYCSIEFANRTDDSCLALLIQQKQVTFRRVSQYCTAWNVGTGNPYNLGVMLMEKRENET